MDKSEKYAPEETLFNSFVRYMYQYRCILQYTSNLTSCQLLIDLMQ